jgi:peptidoglycan hydrolase-like protein with peptidoglycan-binding domain
MLRDTIRMPRAVLAAALLAMSAVQVADAQSRVALPAGTVIIVRTTSPLNSLDAQTGTRFETTVEGRVGVDDYEVIPAGSRIRGVITLARAASRQESGVIEVVFDRLTLPDGSSLEIAGKLTSTDSAERRQIKSDPNARVVLVGGRGGLGAAIAGAGSGRTPNSILAALGGMLSEGRDVNVPAGTALAVELARAVTLRGRMISAGADASTIYTSADRIRAAQGALARLGYYRGTVDGNLNDATRRALFEFQVDRRLSATGNLDGETARSLGIAAVVTGTMLNENEASMVRRNAQALVTRFRNEISATPVGRLNPNRAYPDSEVELWFSLSAFAEHAALYEQIVRNGGNREAGVAAGKSLVETARRVDAALRNATTSVQLRNDWGAVRAQLRAIDSTS